MIEAIENHVQDLNTCKYLGDPSEDGKYGCSAGEIENGILDCPHRRLDRGKIICLSEGIIK